MLITIDPGEHTGWALWNVAGLVACGLGDPRLCPRHIVTSTLPIDVVNDALIEFPVIYPRSPVPPNDIVKLAGIAGEWKGAYQALGVAVRYVEPSKWKGQVPKKKHNLRVLASLVLKDRLIVNAALADVAESYRNNVIDAVGLGLWARAVRR